MKGFQNARVEVQPVCVAGIANTSEPSYFVNLVLHWLLGFIHTDVRHFNLFVTGFHFSGAFIGCTQTVEFGLCFVGCALKDGCSLRQRLILGIEHGVLAAEVANFGDCRLVADNLSLQFVCPSPLVSSIRFKRQVSFAHFLSGPGGKLFTQTFKFVSLTVKCTQDLGGVFSAELLFQLVKRTDKPGLNIQGFTQSSIFRPKVGFCSLQ